MNNLHGHITSDHDLTGPQKFHKKIVPRIGGISIWLASTTLFSILLIDIADKAIIASLLICGVFIFIVGIAEDLTKKISVRSRLFWLSTIATLFIYLSSTYVTRIDISIADKILIIPWVGITFTIFAITGLTNAYNIIDGFHGLSSMVGIITLLAIGYLGFITSDPLIVQLSLILVGSIFGFFIWNYPRGLIFLGDSGAYLIGFWIASLSIVLVCRHPEISPWVSLLINGFPIAETLFTIYRRKIHQGKSPGQPDGIHIHTLIYRRILIYRDSDRDLFSANAKTSPYLWALTIISITPVLLWPKSTAILVVATTTFTSFYIWMYASIVKFKTPKWLHLNK